MSKLKISIIIVVFLIAFCLIAVLLWVNGTKKTSVTDQYQLAVHSFAGQYSLAVTKNGKTFTPNQGELNRYVSIGYNTPRDMLWINCASGYEISSIQSKPQTDSILTDVNGKGVTLSETTTTHIQINCQKINPLLNSK